MVDKNRITTAYILPFEVKYAKGRILSSGTPVELVAKPKSRKESDQIIISRIVEVFTSLAATGALAGKELNPGRSELRLKSPLNDFGHEIRVTFLDSIVDERALIVLTNLFLATQETLLLESFQLLPPGGQAMEPLQSDPSALSTYPDIYGQLPFTIEDEDPEGGSYTFTVELRQPLEGRHEEILENSLFAWTEAVLAGAYGLAPIPPQESYVELYEDHVTSFETTVEWAVFKVRADPACINGVVNIFAAFHDRCQEILHLRIS